MRHDYHNITVVKGLNVWCLFINPLRVGPFFVRLTESLLKLYKLYITFAKLIFCRKKYISECIKGNVLIIWLAAYKQAALQKSNIFFYFNSDLIPNACVSEQRKHLVYVSFGLTYFNSEFSIARSVKRTMFNCYFLLRSILLVVLLVALVLKHDGKLWPRNIMLLYMYGTSRIVCTTRVWHV